MHDRAHAERFFRRTVLLLLIACGLIGVLATALHLQQAVRRPLDLVLPPLLSLMMFGLFIYLYRRPDSLLQVIWAGVLCAFLVIAIPSWHYSIAAWRDPSRTLIGTLPPITALVLPLLLVMIVFLRPRHLLAIAVGAWLVIAVPILAYLVTHHQELTTPRGLDMVITLGPVTLMVVIFIPFQRGIEHWITRLQSERAHAQAQADRDVLTGLYNRRAGERFLADVLDAPADSDVLILLDIDRFKNINDTHGHPVGDAVLREVAQRCAVLLRKSDVFARWGGEEFLVLVRGTGEAGVLRVAHDLRAAISATPIAPAGVITASFGVARLQADDTVASWLKRVDEALYEAKHTGRDRVVGR